MIVCAGVLAAGAARAAVGDYLGKPVASVRLTIEGRETTEPALAQIVETQAGRPLSMVDVRESVRRLFSLGRFEDVRVDATLSGAGVALVYDLSPIHAVGKIVFAGPLDVPGIDVGQLRRAVVDRYGASPPLGRTADLTRTIVDALVERGYLHAEVKPSAERQHAPDRATLIFTIEPGPRTLIGDIDVVGEPGILRAELLKQLDLAMGIPYQANAINARIERYVESRRSRGYYETKIATAVRLADNDRVANLTLTVTPGPHGRVVFTGDSLPADKRAELVPIEREGSVDEDLLEDSSNRIEDYLRAQGYRDAKASHTREQLNGELVITFTVRKGPEYRVTGVEITGNQSVPLEELKPVLRLRDGEAFSAADLGADVRTIEDIYRRRGFASAVAQSEVAPLPAATPAQVPVRVRVVVREGVRTLVGSIRIVGNSAVPDTTLRTALGLRPGGAFFDAQLRADSEAMQQTYDDLGYRTATVLAVPNFTPDETQANPTFTIREGPRFFVDQVLIVGNVRTRAETIERELQLKSGDPLSRSAEVESQRRLAALGLFRRTQLIELTQNEETKRDLLVSVEEAPPTTVTLGGGFDVRLRTVQSDGNSVASQKLEFAPRGSFEIARRNLFGKNRSVSLFTSVSLHPSSSGEGFAFPEYRASGTFREPHVFNTAADAFVTGTLEQQIRSSFNFARRGASAELVRKLTRAVSISGSYQIQSTQVFDEIFDTPTDPRLIDRVFSRVRLSSFSSTVVHDTRDDAVDPGSGHYLSEGGQLAARGIGSEVGFAKTFTTAELFHTVPRTRRIVLAGRALLGLADVFPRTVTVAGVDSVVDDLPASERFFAGGDTTVRGYALDTLGTPATKDTDGFALGGSALVIFNAEVRVPIWKAVGVVGFFDTGNVWAHVTDIDLGELRSAVGFGVRYKSPVGPLRIDLGFKLHRDLNAPSGGREGLTALHISLGQAF